MRFSFHFVLICLALLLCLQSAGAAPHAAVRRQDDNATEDVPASTTRESTARQSSVSPTPEPKSTPTPAPSNEASSPAGSDRPSSTAPSSTKPSESPSIQTEVPSTDSSSDPAPSSSPSNGNSPLPIPPKLTPAMGISGVILLLTGLAYGIIGIKKKMVYIFGSAAYLSALAVTVLIVYLMNPPVSDAIQGAFFVAAFFTGIIFGGISLVFSDMTEGFGCLLGGFCLSMWFLSLKHGGLIESSTGRAIFIGCMAAAGYSLSFSRYTRNYGLIGSIAFSGATAAVLGIDCLAGAGWKEFWLYLWALNDSTFPLNTNTYPVTKNIKAELAGVVIIAAAGIVSQLRVWRMIQEHREKAAVQQLEKQQDQDREEEERARQIEDEFQKERAQWEAAYGGKPLADSSSGSSLASPKDSTSMDIKEIGSNNSSGMLDMANGGVVLSDKANKASGGMVTVSVLKDDEIQAIDAQGNPIVEDRTHMTPEMEHENGESDTPEGTSQLVVAGKQSRPSSVLSPPPAVVPLPFKVPEEENAPSDDNDNNSISAVPESEDEAADRPAMTKRVSDVSAMRQRISREVETSPEGLFGAQDREDDCASSVAATLDDDDDQLSVYQLSPVQSPIGTEHDGRAAEHEKLSADDGKAQDVEASTLDQQTFVPMTEAEKADANQSYPQKSGVRRDTVVFSSKTSSSDQRSKGTQSNGSSSSGASQAEQEERRVSVLREGALPDNMSKVALSYRTNEWAKHLEAAEKPDYEDTFLPTSSTVMLPNGTEEKPVPVSEELVAPLKENQRNSKRISSGSRVQRNSTRNSLALSQESLVDPQIYTQFPPGAVLSRAHSTAKSSVLAPLPTDTLMSKRETLLKNRASALNAGKRNSSTGNLLSGLGQDNEYGYADEGDEEEMTLAQRRRLLQRQSSAPLVEYEAPLLSPRRAPPSASQKWQNKAWASQGAPAGFDSHQPQRSNSAQSNHKREQLYAGWRDSIRNVGPAQTSTTIMEQQRAALLFEQRQKEVEKQQRELVQQQRASQMDSLMRSGHMMDAHREAMRRMQANANRLA
ncbi:uncharacterized protein yc1106_05819 [Curvularia clavata]|uniref:TM7S3/TM198-like domain-containing protein n=1 Tax=Curvularia clavata TaxID=95742 RepID=A0A9Q8ZB85_CURCL|nr:uncharacterized protein yc1106_05819 [Curvularia clavata]